MIIDIQKSAYRDLKRIDKQKAIFILKVIQKLKDYPNVSNIKKLTNFYPPYRLRIGDYRVIFDVVDNTIFIDRILHRKESYK